jgi:hypothetical protein
VNHPEVLINRVKSLGLKTQPIELRAEILQDTTPVPFFGNYLKSSVVSVAMNPSSKEFPKQIESRRLTHLSDLKLSENFFRDGSYEMTDLQAQQIIHSCERYFEVNSYTWFDYAGMAMEGLGASYKTKSADEKSVCHTDIFPWATRRFGDLSQEAKGLFKRENALFLEWFLSRDIVEYIVVLGGETWSHFKEFEFVDLQEHISIKSKLGASFSSGKIRFGGNSKQVFYTSQGPSVHKGKEYKELVHREFAEFLQAVH